MGDLIYGSTDRTSALELTRVKPNSMTSSLLVICGILALALGCHSTAGGEQQVYNNGVGSEQYIDIYYNMGARRRNEYTTYVIIVFYCAPRIGRDRQQTHLRWRMRIAPAA